MRLYKIIPTLLTAALVLASCNSEPDRAQVVSKLRSAAKLSTVEYVVTKVVSANEERLFLKNKSFFAKTKAYIKAGIDMNKLGEDDIVIEGTKISMNLPPIELTNFSYPAEGYEIVKKYTDNNSRSSWNNISVKDKDDYYRQGETDIRDNIEDLGIVSTAETNTIKFFTRLLESAGFEEIYIKFKESSGTLQENRYLKEENTQLLNELNKMKTELKKKQ